jgi:gliding motility-associated-like protein
VRYFSLIIILLLPAFCKAQLSAPGANAVRYTSYPSSTVKDPVFIFCGASGSQKGLINASSPSGTAPFNFTWYKWSDVTKSFSILFKTQTGVTTSSASDLDDGGYRVLISGGKDTTLTGWVFIDKPFSSAALQNFTCDYVALKGQAAIDIFKYRNIANGDSITLPNKASFLWSSDPPSSIPYPDFYLDPRTFDPPLVDVTYKLEVSDDFGCKSESSFFYKSIHVKADFTADPVKGEAPLVVTFTDNSVRASRYKWEFGDSIASALTIRQTYSSVSSTPDPHTYYIPGEYSVKLTVESDLHCIDSMRLDQKIIVDESELHVPNVFTPNGDGINDNFMIEAKSLSSLSVEIFSKSGVKVYSFYGEGKLITDWKGWDGNVNNTSAKASPGVYFYVMKASGWDNKRYSGKEYRGFVYLYR